jgi:hypothetical protein
MLFILSILLGSIATSLVLVKLFTNDWTIVPRLPGGHVGGFLLVLPYLWLGILALIVYLASKIFEKTKKGYKYNHWLIVGLSVLLSIILGSVVFASKAGDFVETKMREHIQPYRQYQELREKVWHAPENGILPGRIMEIKSDKLIIVTDITKMMWEVDIEEGKKPVFVTIEVGMDIVAVGEKTGDDTFKAEGLRPGSPVKERLKNLIPKGENRPI